MIQLLLLLLLIIIIIIIIIIVPIVIGALGTVTKGLLKGQEVPVV